MEVTRNIVDQREDAEQRGADAVEGAAVGVEDVVEQDSSSTGTSSSSAIVRRVVAELAQHPAGGGEGAAGFMAGALRAREVRVVVAAPVSRRWTRRRAASSTRWRKASSTARCGAGRGAPPVCRRRAADRTRISSRRWQRSASSMTWEEMSSVVPRSAARRWKRLPQVAAEHGVEADRGLVQNQQFEACRAGRRRGRRGSAGRRRGFR